MDKLVVVSVTCGVVLWVVCGVALGSVGHAPAGAVGGVFSPQPAGVGVLGGSGDVFVADRGEDQGAAHPRVQRFDSAGGFVSSFGVGSVGYNDASAVAVVPSGLGAVYVLGVRSSDGAGGVTKFAVDGTPMYALDVAGSGTTINFYSNSAVAVDPVDGSVFVAATDGLGVPVVDRFDGSSGVFLSSFDGSVGSSDGLGFGCLSGLAVDGSHEVFVVDGCKGRVDGYSAAGVFVGTVDDGGRGLPRAVGVDPVSGDVYVAEAGRGDVAGLTVPHVTQFAGGGGAAAVATFDLGETFGLGGFFGVDVVGMAVSSGGTVYVADSATARVARFVSFVGPTVVTGGVSSVGPREATLEGTVDPGGVAASCHFDYGPGSSYSSRSPETTTGSGSGAVAVSAAVTGLSPNLSYSFRLVCANSSGSILGDNQTFTSGAAPPEVDGSPAFVSVITPRSASVHGTVNPNRNLAASWRIEYGTTTAYGSVGSGSGTLCVFSCGGSDSPVVSALSGLQPGTLYHFRVVAENPLGTDGPQLGADQTFITAPAAGSGGSGVTTKRASLTGTINPHGAATTYHFNYGATSAYGVSTPEVDGGSSDGDRLVSQPVSGLLADMTYHVQVVATTGNVVRFGADGLFRTGRAPIAEAISPIGVTTSAATLTGRVDTYGLAGSYRFDVSSLDGSYTSSTVDRPVSGNASAEQVSVPVGGLPAGETFVVQLRVTSNDTTQVSDLVTFATPSVPRVFPLPPAGDGTSAYGCTAPRLNSYNAKPKPGETISISGQDLGVGGSVVLGDRSVVPADWSASGFKLEIPDNAAGTLGLTVNCGQRSNTIAIVIFQQPDNRFSVTNTTVKGSTATLSVKLPGPGKLTTTATHTKSTSATIKKTATAKVTVKLSTAGVRVLSRSKGHQLKVGIRVRFTPAGGLSATKIVTVTFKRNNTGR